jgi:hypothetical protein
MDEAGFGGYEVAEGVGCVIATFAVFIRIGLGHVFGPPGVMLEIRQGFQKARASLMNKKGGGQVRRGISEAMENLGPAVNTIHAGLPENDSLLGVIFSDGLSLVLTEDIGAGNEAGEGAKTPGRVARGINARHVGAGGGKVGAVA